MQIQRAQDEARQRMDELFASMGDRYVYPNGISLHPNSHNHQQMISFLVTMATAGKKLVDDARSEWKKLQLNVESFVPLDEAERLIKEEDQRRPVRIVIPQSYSTRQTWCTYMAQVFINNPIHPLRGGGPEDEYGAALMERVIQQQAIWFKESLALHTAWKNAFTLGIGACHIGWDQHRTYAQQDIEVTPLLAQLQEATSAGLRAQSGDRIRFQTEQLAYEGTRLTPIDPFKLLLDPSKSANDIQLAKFVGWGYSVESWQTLDRERDLKAGWFNGEFAAALGDNGMGRSIFNSDDSGRGSRLNIDNTQDTIVSGETGQMGEVQMYIRIVPRDFGLGPETTPQVFDCAFVGDRIITRCERLRNNHNMFPVAFMAPNAEHTTIPVSHLATGYGMQEAMDFFLTSHVSNVRKALHDMFIVDPSAIEWDDIKAPGPGKLIRLRRHRLGQQNIDAYIKQFEVKDVTSQNLGSIEWLKRHMSESIGVNDVSQGNLSSLPERPGQRGVQGAITASLSRFQTDAQIIGQQFMQDVGYQAAYNTKQFMTQEMWVQILGRNEEHIRRIYPNGAHVLATPDAINIPFDIVPMDGTVPGTEDIGAWTTIMQTMMGTPGVIEELVANMDVSRMFLNWARMTGAKNLQEFLKTDNQNGIESVTSFPDQTVQDSAQRGNIVPFSEIQNQFTQGQAV